MSKKWTTNIKVRYFKFYFSNRAYFEFLWSTIFSSSLSINFLFLISFRFVFQIVYIKAIFVRKELVVSANIALQLVYLNLLLLFKKTWGFIIFKGCCVILKLNHHFIITYNLLLSFHDIISSVKTFNSY